MQNVLAYLLSEEREKPGGDMGLVVIFLHRISQETASTAWFEGLLQLYLNWLRKDYPFGSLQALCPFPRSRWMKSNESKCWTSAPGMR